MTFWNKIVTKFKLLRIVTLRGNAIAVYKKHFHALIFHHDLICTERHCVLNDDIKVTVTGFLCNKHKVRFKQMYTVCKFFLSIIMKNTREMFALMHI